MTRKPWPIIILALINLLMPIFNIVLSIIVFKLPILESFHLYFTSAPLVLLVKLFLPAIISAYAIYAVKKWSYMLVFIVYSWIFASNTYSYFQNPESTSILVAIFVFMFNFIIVSYFLLPAIRETYLNPRLRWWEARPRYNISGEEILIHREKSDFIGKISDLSIGGLFITMQENLNRNDLVTVQFQLLGFKINTEAKVVYLHPKIKDGIGLQFSHTQNLEKKKMTTLIKKIKKNGYQETRPPEIWTEDLFRWLLTFFKTGKGLVPNIPNKKNS